MGTTRPGSARRRTRGSGGGPRTVKITVRFSAEEAALVRAAAGLAGLSVSAWLGKAGTRAAVFHEGGPAGTAGLRAVLAVLTAVRGQQDDILPVLCSAVGRLERPGAPGPDLEPVVGYIGRVAKRTDQAVVDLAAHLLNDSP